jgi:nicotinate-nucleotide adenylyltransferase
MMESCPTAKRIGIIGGSFDPPHVGHLIIAQDAADHLGLSEVVFIPAAVPPHKQHVQQAAAEHRLNMLQLAVEPDVRFSVSDIEIQRGGLSFSVDTVKAMRAIHHDADLFLIVGSDTLVELHTWHRIEELLQMCSVAAILRPGIDSLEVISRRIQVSEPYRTELMDHVIEAHRIGISSTEIRRRIADGEGIGYLVPPAVETYIYEHGLYQR